MHVVCLYEDHSEIIYTPLAFWRLGEIKNFAHSKVKREGWTGRKREKAGQLCPSTETGAVQDWVMVDSSCQLYSFNQAINDCIITSSNCPTKTRYRTGSYQWQIFFIKLPKIEDRISLSSGYHGLILKDALYREQVGRVWKWVIVICVGAKPFLACFRQFFSIHERLSTISSPTLTWSSIHLLFSPVLKIERKYAGNGSFDSKGSWRWCKGDVEVPFKSRGVSFFLVFVQRV